MTYIISLHILCVCTLCIIHHNTLEKNNACIYKTNKRTSLRLLMEGKETESSSASLSIISACCSFSPSSQGGYGADN